MDHIGRKSFLHEVPSWIDPETSEYFITICCQRRGVNQLCLPGVASYPLEAARVYREQQKWFPSPFLLMPDHLHMLVSFGRRHTLNKIVEGWKRYTARHAQVEWQRGFFEHRRRRDESVQEKAEYILQNPVRQGLVEKADEWTFVLRLD